MTDKKINSRPVIVSGLHAADNPSPGTAVAKCLKDAGYHVIGLSHGVTETGAYIQGLFDSVYLMPQPEDDPFLYIERLIKISNTHKSRTLIPTRDPDVLFIANHAEKLKSHGLIAMVPSAEYVRNASKDKLQEAAQKSGFYYPSPSRVFNLHEARAEAKKIGLPVMMKGAWYEAHLIEYMDELPAQFRHLRKRWGLPVLLQPYVSGAEAVVACLCDNQHTIVRSIALRKLGMSSQGTTWMGVTFVNHVLKRLCERLVKTLKWVGPCEIEVFMNEDCDHFTLIEFNTRFPSWVSVGLKAGMNMPADQVRLLKGENLRPKSAEEGVMLVRCHNDFASDVGYMLDMHINGEIHG